MSYKKMHFSTAFVTVKCRPSFIRPGSQAIFPTVGLPFLASLVGHLKLGNWATKRQREREREEPTGGQADSD